MANYHAQWVSHVERWNIELDDDAVSLIEAGDEVLDDRRLAVDRRRSATPRERAEVLWIWRCAVVGDHISRRCTPKKWANDTSVERATTLNEINAVLEVEYFGRIGRRVDIEFAQLSDGVAGIYAADGSRTIRVNIKQLDDPNPFEAIATLVHERSHDLQWMWRTGLGPPGELWSSMRDRRELDENSNAPYRARAVEIHAFATEALVLLRYSLRADGHPRIAPSESLDSRAGIVHGFD